MICIAFRHTRAFNLDRVKSPVALAVLCAQRVGQIIRPYYFEDGDRIAFFCKHM